MAYSELCISVSEMAKRLGVCRTTAYDLAHSASFYPAIHVGKRILINVEQLGKWLQEQGA